MDSNTMPTARDLIEVTGPGGFNWKCDTCPGTAWSRTKPIEERRCIYETDDGHPCGGTGTVHELPPKTYRAKVSKVQMSATRPAVPLALLIVEGGGRGAVSTPWTPERVISWVRQ